MPLSSTQREYQLQERTRAMETAGGGCAPPILTQGPLCLLYVGASSICLYRPFRFPTRPRSVENRNPSRKLAHETCSPHTGTGGLWTRIQNVREIEKY